MDKCIICYEETEPDHIVKPVCRCTKKQTICRDCYNATCDKLNIVCTLCMEKGSKPKGSLFYSDAVIHTLSHRLLKQIIIKVDPVILALMAANHWLALVAYLVLSMLITLFIIIPLCVSGGIEIFAYHYIQSDRVGLGHIRLF